MEHKMHLYDDPFQMIKSGTKTIEMRLNDEKRRKVFPGDIIEFSNDTTGEVIKADVVGLHIFKNFTDLYSHFDKESIGYKKGEECHPSDMEKYYSKEDISKYGVVGIEIKLK